MNAPPLTDPFGFVGHVIDNRYRVDAVVAQGGFGVVYRATHSAYGAAVAFKALKVPQTLSEPMQRAFVEQFRSEAAIIAGLDHPAIVRVTDFGVAPMNDGSHVPWMALEWIAGPTLAQDLAARRGCGGRAPEECLGLLRPVLEALAMAHERGIAHRDLKPGNFMFRSAEAAVPAGVGRGRGGAGLPRLRLLDFGIAKQLDGDLGPGSGQTQTSSLLPSYSPSYAAPEQLSQTRTGPWTDVHALGLILSELLLDAAPYPTDDKHKLAAAAFAPQRPTPGRFGKDVGAWEAVLAKALALHPRERFANAGELLDALEAALPRSTGMTAAPKRPEDVVPPAPSDDVFGPLPPARKRHPLRWPAILAAAVATGGVAALVVAVASSGDPPPAPPPSNAAPATPTPTVTESLALGSTPGPTAVVASAPTEPPAVAPPSPTQPPPVAPQPVTQVGESPRERRAREARERADHLAAARAAPAPAPALESPVVPPATNDGLSSLERVSQCRSAGGDEGTRNSCIINALRGRASSDQELRILAMTYQVAGRRGEAIRTMQTYIQRYPQGSMAQTFTQYIRRNSME